MIDDILVIYENSGKYFGSYYTAYLNGQKVGSKEKNVYYVFTPTMQRCKRVCELENLYRNYFHKHKCTYYDFNSKTLVEQLNLFKEV